MPRMYRVPFAFDITAANTDVDIVSIQPADDKPCRLVGFILGQDSEVGDTQEEGLRITIRHMTATVTIGSGGSSPTPVANRPGTADVAAAGFTARVGDATVSTTSGTSVVMEELAWNLRSSPWERWIPEELRPLAMQGEVLILRNETTVVDTISLRGVAFIEEC